MFIDMHMHEMTCSKDSFLKLDQIVSIAREKGLGAVCITDHDSMGLREYAAEYSRKVDFPIFVGIEFFSLQGDIVAFGIEDYPRERVSAQEFIDLVKAQNGVCFAAHMILIDRFTKRHDPFFLTFVQTGTMAALSWCLAPVLDGGMDPAPVFTADFAGSILYLAVLATTGGFVLQNLGQKYLSANTASILLSLESVFGALFSVWLLHERMTGRMVLGCGLMFAAVLLAEVKFEQVVVYCRKAQRS